MSYDNAGRLTHQVKYETGQIAVVRSYEWDALDRLTKGQKVTDPTGTPVTKTLHYAYKASGLRVRRVDVGSAVTKLYSYQGNNLASVQEGCSTKTFNQDALIYSVGPGMINNVLERHAPNFSGGTTASQYYQYDHRGNAAIVTDANGKVKYGYEYDAFGNLSSSFEEGESEGPKDDILFTGKDLDPDLELYYFDARWYDPETGRFVSQAPFSASEEHPYAYCGNNPVSTVDPSGMQRQPGMQRWPGYITNFPPTAPALMALSLSDAFSDNLECCAKECKEKAAETATGCASNAINTCVCMEACMKDLGHDCKVRLRHSHPAAFLHHYQCQVKCSSDPNGKWRTIDPWSTWPMGWPEDYNGNILPWD